MRMRQMNYLLLAAVFFSTASAGMAMAETKQEYVESTAVSQDRVNSETERDSSKVAERISFSEIREGDRFVIMKDDDACMRAISSVSGGLTMASVKTRGTEEELTYIPKQCAVFTLEDVEDGDFYLRAEDGYLSVDEENGLHLSEACTEDSRWRLEDENVLLHPLAAASSDESSEGDANDSDLYLQYHDGARYFYAASLNEDDDPAGTVMRFYKLAEGYSPETDLGGGYRLPVIETSDIHGYLVDLSGEKYAYRYARMAALINDVRSADGQYREDTSILLDGGDIFQGYILSNLLKGDPVSEVFAMMHYDAVTIGNHEFDWGIENVIDADHTLMDYEKDGVMQPNNTPVIISNLYKDGEKVAFADDSIILEKTAVNDEGDEVSVRVGVIGFADDYSLDIMYDKFTGAGYEIREDYDALAKQAMEMKQKEQCDAVILLTHSDALPVAQNLKPDSEIDLVLGGHMHMNDMGENEQGVAYLMPDGLGKAYCYADLVFDLDEDGKPIFRAVEADTTVELKTGELYAGMENAEKLDSDIVSVCDEAIEQVNSVLKEEIGYITVSSDRYTYFPESGERASTGGNWYCSITARSVGADVGFYNRYGMRADVMIPQGEERAKVSVADVYNMFPFDNHVYCFELTMEEFKTLIEYSLTEGGSQLLTMMTGIDCYYTDRTVNALLKDGELLYRNGEWIDGHEADKIRIGASEYIVTTDKPDDGLSNPLVEWKDTDKVVSCDVIDVEGALKVLKEEAAKNDGLLSIDTHSCFVRGEYEGS